MGGRRCVLRWLGLLDGGDIVEAFQISNELGGFEVYSDEIVPPLFIWLSVDCAA